MWDDSLLVLLCDHCHTAVHAEPEQAYAAGWLVRRVT